MRLLRDSLSILGVLTVLCGAVYPLAMTGIAQLLFPGQAQGSLVRNGGAVVGSRLIGQPFDDPAYLWPRPSATGGRPYNAGLSGGSNLGPLHEDLATAARERVEALRAQPGTDPAAPVPVDLITASGSGLDPHISPAAAYYQAGRIAVARNASLEEVRRLIDRRVESRTLGILGEPRVNVLLVNLDLDGRLGAPVQGDSAAVRGGGSASEALSSPTRSK